MTGKMVLNKIEKVQQYNNKLKIDQAIEFKLTSIRPPSGNGNSRKRRNITSNINKWMDGKRCFIQIKNTDNLCLARAVVTVISHLNKENQMYEFEKINHGNQGRKTSVKK